MPTAVTPVLSSSAGYQADIHDQVQHLVAFMIYNPGNTSDLWENQLLSFRLLAAQFQHNREDLAHEVSTRLQNVCKKRFKDFGFDVRCETYDAEEGDDDGRYTLSISVMYTPPGASTSYSGLVSGKIFVTEKPYEIQLKWDKAVVI